MQDRPGLVAGLQRGSTRLQAASGRPAPPSPSAAPPSSVPRQPAGLRRGLCRRRVRAGKNLWDLHEHPKCLLREGHAHSTHEILVSCFVICGKATPQKRERMKCVFLIFFMNLLSLYAGKSLRRDGSYPKTFEDIKNEIAGYTDIAKAIIDLAVYGKAQNRSYERLAVFADTIGPRLSGMKNLDSAIKYMFSALREDGLENVHLEPVKVPHWERGEEFAMMLEPRNHSIAILGLGSSVGTPPEGITAEVIVVGSFDELHKRAQEAKGKIVVYNEPFVSYGETVRYRSQGAVEAAKVGAVASLIRSIASFSIHSPHTGWQNYQPGVPRIPTACISVEDAEMMSRMSLRGIKIIVHLKMGAKTYPDAPSFNTVAEIVGSKYPEQIVLVSGHLDSWDVGQGAMDDGGGAFISWEALSLIKDLGLHPKRTLRLVLWTGEEQGGIGAEQYYQLHKVILPQRIVAPQNQSFQEFNGF
ncbi:carboxypeptidase Q isoform X5 [Lathamus discolor]|uniref:carboxypeptidase Q isoform X5 n=1 Tax=Lathamus discolor TaxID=678569 RepID=UPI0032B87E5A